LEGWVRAGRNRLKLDRFKRSIIQATRRVDAQELVPGKVGTMAGLFFGLAFGLGGIGSAVLGALADRRGIQFVFQVCSYLPLIGLLTAFLPNLGTPRLPRRSRA
jgi:FSR family fosmidomycin resistance protein-like MFS transporter